MKRVTATTLMFGLLSLSAGSPAFAGATATGKLFLQVELTGDLNKLEWNYNSGGSALETWSLANIFHYAKGGPSTRVATANDPQYDWYRVPGWTPVPNTLSINYTGSSVSNSNSATDVFKPTGTSLVTSYADGVSPTGYVDANSAYVYQVGLHATQGGQFRFKATVTGDGSVDTERAGDLAQVTQSVQAYIMLGAWNNDHIEYESPYLEEDGGYNKFLDQRDGSSNAVSNVIDQIDFSVDFLADQYFFIRMDAGIYARTLAVVDSAPTGVPEPITLGLVGLGLLGLGAFKGKKVAKLL